MQYSVVAGGLAWRIRTNEHYDMFTMTAEPSLYITIASSTAFLVHSLLCKTRLLSKLTNLHPCPEAKARCTAFLQLVIEHCGVFILVI